MSDAPQGSPVAYMRGDGQRRYQPRTSTGLCLWRDRAQIGLNGCSSREWSLGPISIDCEPITYRSRARAQRVANRQDRRDRKRTMKILEEETSG